MAVLKDDKYYSIAIEVLRHEDNLYQGFYLFIHKLDTNLLFKSVYLPKQMAYPPIKYLASTSNTTDKIGFVWFSNYQSNFDQGNPNVKFIKYEIIWDANTQSGNSNSDTMA